MRSSAPRSRPTTSGAYWNSPPPERSSLGCAQIVSGIVFWRRRVRTVASMSSSTTMYRPILALLLLIALIATVLVFPLRASASTIGPGYQQPGKPLNHLGGYLTLDGRIAYCIDVGLPSTVGRETKDSGIVSSVNSLASADMIKLNTVLSRYGETWDANTAAAVAMTVWSIAGNGAYEAAGGDAQVLERAPAEARMAIQALADRFRAEAAATSSTPPTAALSISIAEGDDYAGTVALDASPGISGTVELTNAVFADTGTGTRASVSAGARLAVIARPLLGATGYRVLASSVDLAAPTVPTASIHVFSTLGAQTLVASGGSSSVVLSASASDHRDRMVPSLNTTAQPSAIVGETVIDTASLANVPSSGVQLRWAGYLQSAGSTSPVCTDASLAFASADSVTVTADGEFDSEAFAVTDRLVGTVYWIAQVSRNGVVVAEGTCGDRTEITEISLPEVPVPLKVIHLPVVSG